MVSQEKERRGGIAGKQPRNGSGHWRVDVGVMRVAALGRGLLHIEVD